MGAPRDAVGSLRIGCLTGCGAALERGRASAGVTACGFAGADPSALGARNQSGAREGA